MEEEKSILECVYKVCKSCGQRRTLRNYRLLEKSELADELILIADKFSNICKCCESHPEFQSKANRIANINEKMARFKENNRKRMEKIKAKEMIQEIAEMGLRR